MVSIKNFQEMMKRIYFTRDEKRGSDKTFTWLKEEINELGEAMRNTNKKALEDEFADVLAWLASLANVLHIDLENATLDKYNNCCPKCGASPCNCSFTLEKD